jgi:hypothetical protein
MQTACPTIQCDQSAADIELSVFLPTSADTSRALHIDVFDLVCLSAGFPLSKTDTKNSRP